MDINSIRQLAEIMQKTGLTSIEIEDKEGTVRLKREQNSAFEATQVPVINLPEAVPANDSTPKDSTVVDFNNVVELKSDLVGTFYCSPAPGEPPFVNVGDKVKKGDVLCIIESMKIMNEYVADQDGEIIDICVKDGQFVEYGQCLFRLFKG
ncbi:MAG TPA: acetyl-CoA carboxylase biotin carboxyl carrier protein [Clostridiales bacterium]|nr:acetyl-CoA carboxylase biotin carboxyl carrier protein [Clostridiales bacterium]